MKLARCAEGHFYDADIYSDCPHCGVLPPAADMIPDHILPAGVNAVDEDTTAAVVPEFSSEAVPESAGAQDETFSFEPVPIVDHQERAARAEELTQGSYAAEKPAPAPVVSRLIISGISRPDKEPVAERSVPQLDAQQAPKQQTQATKQQTQATKQQTQATKPAPVKPQAQELQPAAQPVAPQEPAEIDMEPMQPLTDEDEPKMTAGSFSARIIFRGSEPVDIGRYDYSIVHNGPMPVPNPPSKPRDGEQEEPDVQPVERPLNVIPALEPEREETVSEEAALSVMEESPVAAEEPAAELPPQPSPEGVGGYAVLPVGWLVCTDPGCRGMQLTLCGGMSYIGREPEVFTGLQIAGRPELMDRAAASIEYDDAAREYLFTALSDMGDLRVNGKRVNGSRRLCSKDRITIEGRSYVFVALCGHDFGWQ